MFDIGLQEMLVIGVLALLVFGPSKLPELGRMFGRAMREFRRASDEFRSTVETNLNINDTEPPSSTPPTVTDAPEGGTTPATSSLPSEMEPAVRTETPVVSSQSQPEHAEPFCAKRGAKLFHRIECSWLTRVAEIDRVYLKTVADARDQGFVTCPVCEPWEPV